MTWIRRHLPIALLSVLVTLSLAISGALAYQQYQLAHLEHASHCWDEVLVVAVRDHLTTAQRAALVREANHCITETGS